MPFNFDRTLAAGEAEDIGDVQAMLNQLKDYVNSLSGAPFVPGDLKASALAAPEAGWLSCDGTAVSRTTYAALFAAIGTTWGTGDGSTTFNVPDYRGRTLVMPDGAAGRLSANDTLGASGGVQEATLGSGDVEDHGHLFTYSTGAVQSGGGATAVIAISPSSDAISVETGDMDPAGGGSHQNMQPYGTANVFIKT